MSKPHGSGSVASNNGPRERAEPRVIKLRPKSLQERTDRQRARREIEAREGANSARRHALNSGTDADHFAAVRAGNRARAEASMNDRYQRAGGG